MWSMVWVVLQVVAVLIVTMSLSLCIYMELAMGKKLAVARSLPTVYRKPFPLLGHLPYIIHPTSLTLSDTVERIASYFTLPGGKLGTACIWLGWYPLVVVNQPDDVKKLFNSPLTLNKSVEYSGLELVFGRGIITASAPIWNHTRKQMITFFHKRNLLDVVPDFNVCCQRLVDDLRPLVGQGPQDVMPRLFKFTVRSIFVYLFSSEASLYHDDEFIEDCAAVIDGFSIISTKKIYTPWLWVDFIAQYYFRRLFKRADCAWRKLQAAEIKDKLEKDEITDVKCDGAPRMCLADVFTNLQMQSSEFDKDYFKEETFSMLGTGSETLRVSLSSIMLALSTHPHIQEKVYSEIKEVTGASSDPVSLEQLRQLTYLEQTIKETMRLFNIIPLIARRCEEDIEISDCTIPAGISIVIPLCALHMNPEFYPEPEKFNPDRFSPENKSKNKNTFFPFSGGRRDCVGKHYAMLLMKMAVVYILKQYEMSSVVDINKLKLTFKVDLCSNTGYQIQLRPRLID